MPDASGYELAKEIRARYGEVKPMLIAISGRYKQASDKMLGQIVGFDFFFSSRRRHTMWNCDWSSDVCSSDLRSSPIVSAAYQLGLAALKRERLYDIERANAMQEAAVLALAGKVEVVPDENLLPDFPAHFPAEIEVSAKGATHRERVTAAYGDPSRPLDDAALKDKADRIFTQAGGTRTGSDLIALGLAAFQDGESCKAVAKSFASTPAAVEMLFAQ